MTYALIQKSLTQSIDRKQMEEASVFVPSVARGDCARLHRELFGIVVTGLPHDEAIAFQVALEHYNFPTDIIPDTEIPVLPEPVIRRGLDFGTDNLIAFDGMGRETHIPWADVQFAAGGFLQSVKLHSELHYSIDPIASLIVSQIDSEKRVLEFRFELFLSSPPFRLQFRAGKESLFRFGDQRLRFHQLDQFELILQKLARRLPHSRQSLGIQTSTTGKRFLYPGHPTMEEEVLWHLLKARQ